MKDILANTMHNTIRAVVDNELLQELNFNLKCCVYHRIISQTEDQLLFKIYLTLYQGKK